MEVLLAIYQVSEECMDLAFWLIMFHTCWISKSSASLITQSTFQQQQRNRGKLHKHNICISLHLKLPETNEG